MNLSDLMRLFGDHTALIVLVAGVFVAIVIVAGFLQDRPISFWTLKIGSRPGVESVRLDGEVPTDRLTAATGPAAVVDREYTVDRARLFYQEIAPYYDLRNSGDLVSTHLETVARIQAALAQRSTLRVLDLGGGTGKLIAIHFFNNDAVSWTYVDSCLAMAAEFHRNLAGYPLGRNSEIVVEDLALALRQLEPESYDVVVLSLVLSSMPALPDFALISRLLKPGGSLIVTDINPGYTHDNPLYKVAVDGAVVALRTTPVDPYEVIRRATVSGLRTTEQKMIGEGSTYYSFITLFTPAAVHRLDGERGDESLIRM